MDYRFDRCEFKVLKEKVDYIFPSFIIVPLRVVRLVQSRVVYEYCDIVFSKNPCFVVVWALTTTSVCKILTSRSNVRSRTFDIAIYGLLCPGERE